MYGSWLTAMHVAVEGVRTPLYVKREGVDIKIAGGLRSNRHPVGHVARVVHPHV